MFTVDRILARGALVDYGMFLQNIMVAAREKERVNSFHTPRAAVEQFTRWLD